MELTTEEQIYMVNGQSFFCMGELPEKDIPRVQMLDGGTGLNLDQLFEDMLTKSNHPEKGTATFRKVLNHFFDPDSLYTAEERKLFSGPKRHGICSRRQYSLRRKKNRDGRQHKKRRF